MMALKLPKGAIEPPKKVRHTPMVENDALSPEDYVEYGLTIEVDTGQGKAWVKFGTTSAVRSGETTESALERVTTFVNEEIDRRIDDLS
jgi:hypothetical protein